MLHIACHMDHAVCAEFLQPYKPRPDTNASVARNLVAGALGLSSAVDRKKSSEDRKKLREARGGCSVTASVRSSRLMHIHSPLFYLRFWTAVVFNLKKSLTVERWPNG